MALTRRAFTLIELLVALTITLVMMGAVAALFGVIAGSVADSRSIVEMSDRLRACRNRLQADLQGATATMTPSLRPDHDEGYLEIVEGPLNDSANGFSGPGADLFGDVDDAILLTVRSRGEPFVGVDGNLNIVESQVAEVIYCLRPAGAVTAEPEPTVNALNSPPQLWWQTAAPAGPVKLYTLFRHVRLVLPGVNPGPANATNSIAMTGSNALTLGDLTKPENRFSHQGTGVGFNTFPFQFQMPGPPPLSNIIPTAFSTDDIVMNNVLSFDVQAWDPGGPVFIDPTSSIAAEPRDIGWRAAMLPANQKAAGAYVDLGYVEGQGLSFTPITGFPSLKFSGRPDPKSGWLSPRPFAWDTWSMHYENDGEAQMGTMTSGGSPISDAATNGLDDDADGVVDDIKERDTLPPYKESLRGLRITVRAYEPGSQQVRQITVIQDFHTQ